MGKTKHKFSVFSSAYWAEDELIKKNANALLHGLYENGSLNLSKGTQITAYAYNDKIVFETKSTNPSKTYNLSYSKITDIQKTIETQPDHSFKLTGTTLEEHFCYIKYISENKDCFIKFLCKTASPSNFNYENKSALKALNFFDFVSSKIQNGNEIEVTDL